MFYSLGLENYLQGEWGAAMSNFTQALKFVADD